MKKALHTTLENRCFVFMDINHFPKYFVAINDAEIFIYYKLSHFVHSRIVVRQTNAVSIRYSCH